MVSGDLVGHDVEERGQRAGVAADHPGLRQLSDRVDLAISFVGPWCGPVAMVLSSDPVYNDFFNSFGRELALTRDAVSELKILGLVSPARSPGVFPASTSPAAATILKAPASRCRTAK